MRIIISTILNIQFKIYIFWSSCCSRYKYILVCNSKLCIRISERTTPQPANRKCSLLQSQYRLFRGPKFSANSFHVYLIGQRWIFALQWIVDLVGMSNSMLVLSRKLVGESIFISDFNVCKCGQINSIIWSCIRCCGIRSSCDDVGLCRLL